MDYDFYEPVGYQGKIDLTMLILCTLYLCFGQMKSGNYLHLRQL